MKKILLWIFLVLFSLSGLFPVLAESPAPDGPDGFVAKVTAGKDTLSLTKKQGSGKSVAKVPDSTCLRVLEESGDFCLCEFDGMQGWCPASSLTLLRDADLSILSYRVLSKGDRGDDVTALNARLQDLGYIRSGSTLTNVCNDTLVERIILFQRQLGITEDGIVSQELQAYIFSDKAPECTQTLPRVRAHVPVGDTGRREICGCCMGDGCECCDFKGYISY